jgi:hypothetical protein
MPNHDDPNLSVAPLSKWKPATPAAAGGDPLVELVRMVSDRWVFDPAPVRRRKTVPVPRAVSSDGAVVKDLEAKLLDDLEALSSAFYSHPAPTPSAPPEELAGAAPKPAAAAPPTTNRNKHSLALNLKSASGRNVLVQPRPAAPPSPAPVVSPVATAPAPGAAVSPPRAER